VLLRVEADGLVLAEAVSVRFGRQPEAVFRVPADYRKITPPPESRSQREVMMKRLPPRCV
jgi:hypothetical protein